MWTEEVNWSPDACTACTRSLGKSMLFYLLRICLAKTQEKGFSQLERASITLADGIPLSVASHESLSDVFPFSWSCTCFTYRHNTRTEIWFMHCQGYISEPKLKCFVLMNWISKQGNHSFPKLEYKSYEVACSFLKYNVCHVPKRDEKPGIKPCCPSSKSWANP